MAKRPRSARPQAGAGQQTPEEVVAKVVVDDSEDIPHVYVNFAEISHWQHDFVVSFVQVPAKLSAEQRESLRASGELLLPPLVKLVMPPTLVPGLIRALTNNLAKFEAQYGPIRIDRDEGASA